MELLLSLVILVSLLLAGFIIRYLFRADLGVNIKSDGRAERRAPSVAVQRAGEAAKNPFVLIAGGAVIVLLVALLPLSYWYYMLLRVAVCAAGAVLAYFTWSRSPVAFGLAITAALFNPFLPPDLTREIWALFNVLGAGVFAYAGWFLNSKSQR